MTETKQQKRGLARTLIGTVTSAKAEHTVTVSVVRPVKHPRYGKYIRRTTRLHVHDPKGEFQLGDRVQIIRCSPVSKTKGWRVFKLIERPEVIEQVDESSDS